MRSCFSGSFFPLDTLLRSDDHISRFGAAGLFRRSASCVVEGMKGPIDARIDVEAIMEIKGEARREL
jgi:hypothetical protein